MSCHEIGRGMNSVTQAVIKMAVIKMYEEEYV